MSIKKKDVHISGALASLLSSGDIASASDMQKAKKDTVDEQNRSHISSLYCDYPTQSDTSNIIMDVQPNRVARWLHKDRPQEELGNIEELAKSIELNGQQTPCIVRPYHLSDEYDYELIVGERRWRATKLLGIPLKVIIKNLSDLDAAIWQAEENDKRKSLSDYAIGMSYSKLIKAGILAPKDLIEKLGKSQTDITRLLSFEKVPQEIWDAIGDMTNISARTAAEIRAYIQKGTEYYNAILQLAPKIAAEQIGAKRLRVELMKLLNDRRGKIPSAKEAHDSTGRHLFTWRKDSNSNLSISFPKDIRSLIDKEFEAIESDIVNVIQARINNLKGKTR